MEIQKVLKICENITYYLLTGTGYETQDSFDDMYEKACRNPYWFLNICRTSEFAEDDYYLTSLLNKLEKELYCENQKSIWLEQLTRKT
jgi:hypothetical protein